MQKSLRFFKDKEFDYFLRRSSLHIQKTFRRMGDEMDKRFDELMEKLKLVGERIEITKRKIALLKGKHCNLAKYCHRKIGYPEYGRKL